MNKVGFGIVGCGGAALPVCDALSASPLASLQRVCDLDISLARDLGERYGVSATDQLGDLLNDPAAQALYIAVPHDQLYHLTRRSLQSGKHVLVEKPMCLTLEQADELIALAENKSLALGVFYELRHTRPYAQVRELIQAGVIGEIIGVRVQTVIDKVPTYWEAGYAGRSANPWRGQKARAGGGIVLMNTSHQLDAIHYLTGLEVASVSAEIATSVANVEVEDTAAITLRYTNGALGSIFVGAHLAGARPGYDEHFDIFGTQGQLKVPDAYAGGALQVYLRNTWGDIPAKTWHTLPTEKVNVFAKAIDSFANAVLHSEPAPTGGRDARRVLAIVLAIYQAANKKRTITVQ